VVFGFFLEMLCIDFFLTLGLQIHIEVDFFKKKEIYLMARFALSSLSNLRTHILKFTYLEQDIDVTFNIL
jgi:hypothetical protein